MYDIRFIDDGECTEATVKAFIKSIPDKRVNIGDFMNPNFITKAGHKGIIVICLPKA